LDNGSKAESTAPAGLVLLECDTDGRIAWMSPEAQTVFGAAGSLADAVRAVTPSLGERVHSRPAARFSPRFRTGGSLWITAELAGWAGESARDRSLLSLQSGLLLHYFRLQQAERELSGRTRHMRRQTVPTVIQLDRERQRLGRELHTGVGQMLAAIRMLVDMASTQGEPPSGAVQQALDRISALAGEALDYVRWVSHRLHPPEWQRLTLASALRQLWELSGIPQRFAATLDIGALAQEPVLELKVLMYRAAQEALSNLVRHSRATRIDVTLRAAGATLVLAIHDNGVGFDTARFFAAPANVASGLGLRSIREQAASLGGKLLVESGPNGTTLEISAPLQIHPR
jgi:signal transduction histidine kinase